ncbi:MAG: Fur family transcriptional regulator [Actinomycetota bacterium]
MAEARSPQLRETPARRAVLTVLKGERGRRLTAQQVHRRAEAIRPRIGLATVYRTLGALAQDGVIDVVATGDRESAYRLCSEGHHHHLVCDGCGAVFEIGECDVGEVERRLEGRYRFRITEHSLTFRGRCSRCASG